MTPSSPHPLDIQGLGRSCNQVLILSTLASGPHHGYQLALEIEEKSGGRFRFQHGTLYPILHRLESEGLIRGSWGDEPGRRRRKSYQLTADGRKHLAGLTADWKDFFDGLVLVIGE